MRQIAAPYGMSNDDERRRVQEQLRQWFERMQTGRSAVLLVEEGISGFVLSYQRLAPRLPAQMMWGWNASGLGRFWLDVASLMITRRSRPPTLRAVSIGVHSLEAPNLLHLAVFTSRAVRALVPRESEGTSQETTRELRHQRAADPSGCASGSPVGSLTAYMDMFGRVNREVQQVRPLLTEVRADGVHP